MYLIRSTKAYRKAYKRIARHKDFDFQQLDKIVDALARGEKLDAKYHDHQLSGELKEYRECHIKDDLLLIYERHENILVLVLVNIGTHDTLF